MKKCLLFLVLAGLIVACDKKDDNNGPTDPAPVVTEVPASPTPEAKAGKWCKANRGDFSPCNPAAMPELGSACTIGEKFTGCKGAADCLESCE